MNEFVDMHVHSKFSIDGMSTMEDYCLIGHSVKFCVSDIRQISRMVQFSARSLV